MGAPVQASPPAPRPSPYKTLQGLLDEVLVLVGSIGTGPARSPLAPEVQAVLAGELEALRRCREWLERLDRGETVLVNLRPETDPETEYVAFDRPRVLRVLARIIADLDDWAGDPPITEEKGVQGEDAEARRVRHRQRLAEPEPEPKRLTMREERAALRALLDRPPSGKG
jgi:hypothetical protein